MCSWQHSLITPFANECNQLSSAHVQMTYLAKTMARHGVKPPASPTITVETTADVTSNQFPPQACATATTAAIAAARAAAVAAASSQRRATATGNAIDSSAPQAATAAVSPAQGDAVEAAAADARQAMTSWAERDPAAGQRSIPPNRLEAAAAARQPVPGQTQQDPAADQMNIPSSMRHAAAAAAAGHAMMSRAEQNPAAEQLNVLPSRQRAAAAAAAAAARQAMMSRAEQDPAADQMNALPSRQHAAAAAAAAAARQAMASRLPQDPAADQIRPTPSKQHAADDANRQHLLPTSLQDSAAANQRIPADSTSLGAMQAQDKMQTGFLMEEDAQSVDTEQQETLQPVEPDACPEAVTAAEAMPGSSVTGLAAPTAAPAKLSLAGLADAARRWASDLCFCLMHLSHAGGLLSHAAMHG